MYLIFLISVLLAGVVTHIINSLFGDRETMQINWAGLVFMSFFSLIGYIFSSNLVTIFIVSGLLTLFVAVIAENANKTSEIKYSSRIIRCLMSILMFVSFTTFIFNIIK